MRKNEAEKKKKKESCGKRKVLVVVRKVRVTRVKKG